jgi:hypothetical protein
MKKLAYILGIVLFLGIPLAADAGYLGTGYLDSTYSGPDDGHYYLDYDGRVTKSDFGYTIGWSEIFCVSKED